MRKTFISIGVGLALLNGTARVSEACGISPEIYATQVLSANQVTASNAVVALWRFGEAGFNALLKSHQALLANHNDADPQWNRLRAALDAVGGQRDCYASRLFWRTNFDEAKAEAQRTGKPILSLRLLGNLDEELSCANSRFFRTTLYANKEVSDYLRDHFVLHWKSVRPVPHITVDFGDGRKIERTITGNSIHYVLDAKGEVIDALPGLYGARAFLAEIKNAEQIATQVAHSDPQFRGRLLERYHLARLREINDRWSADIAQAGVKPVQIAANELVRVGAQPAAAAAMPLAASKAVVEQPMLRALAPRRAALESSTDDQLWRKLAALHTNDVVLDANVRALIRVKRPFGTNTAWMDRHILGPERYYKQMFSALENSIAEDTVRNEYLFHAKVHEWLATPTPSFTVDSLNSLVYAELFLTPESDPWLGLAPRNQFSALENGGLVE